jgi:hypothetical protein
MITREMAVTFTYYRRAHRMHADEALRATRAALKAESLASRWSYARPTSEPERSQLWAELKAADDAYAAAIGYEVRA